MATGEIAKLIELDKLNFEMAEIKDKLQTFPPEIVEKQKELDKKSEAFNLKQNQLKEIEKRQRDIDLNIKSNEQKQKEKQIKLNTIKSQRDYELMMQEIEDMKKTNENISNEGLKNIDSIENLKKELLQLKAEADIAEKELKELKVVDEKEKANLKQRLTELEGKNAESRKGISPKTISLYDRLFEKYGDRVVVPIDDGICGGCYFSLPPQFVNSAADTEKIKTCLNCVRIVYLD